MADRELARAGDGSAKGTKANDRSSPAHRRAPLSWETRFQRFLDFDAEITARQLQIAMGVALDPLARQRLGERLAGLILTGPEPRGYQRMRQDLVCRGSSREPNWA